MNTTAALCAVEKSGLGGIGRAVSILKNDSVNYSDLKVETAQQTKLFRDNRSEDDSDVEGNIDGPGMKLYSDVHGFMHFDYMIIDHYILRKEEDS
jgi:hypothetical protein